MRREKRRGKGEVEGEGEREGDGDIPISSSIKVGSPDRLAFVEKFYIIVINMLNIINVV